ncbi:lipocalin family protein [Commensalibacter oyaizuii]|uniref:Outer membrane lipoprotein Blc n=1 Tax=Commensalibacter oyaizuii TaxID=3043873 RepID=A0ABT6Q426_9PROT|nr:lipocalin family protein [Commensalibacter sp. TBRC 16381]MDI2091259.1 lipocalin family protein [Commensalibacter sp. TBRC 16381]
MLHKIPKINKPLLYVGLASILCLFVSACSKKYAIPVVDKIETKDILGTWYEITRKPAFFQKNCAQDTSAHYSLDKNQAIIVENTCYSKEGKRRQVTGIAVVQNPPFNTKLKVSFLPKIIRWLPIGKGDYWILKTDPNHQIMLIGEPRKKYLWLLSRSPQLNQNVIDEYITHAKNIGYNINDLIYTKQTQ